MNDLLAKNEVEDQDPAAEMISPVNAITAELVQLRKLLEAYINTSLDQEQKEKLLAEFNRLQ
jgi:hypothetical protein